MLLPGTIMLGLFSIVPMFGIVLAFKQFRPREGIWGSPWIGLDNFLYAFSTDESVNVLWNTMSIALMKIAGNLIIPLVFALLLNELRIRWYKRTVQTIVYLPHFLSWVILAGVFKEIFSVSGSVNGILGWFGVEPIMFMGSNSWFPTILVSTDIWKEFGFGAIIYLAALTNINPNLYEAAVIDGATRWQQIRFITIPGITSTIVLLGTLSLQNVLNANFDQVLNMYNVMVYDSGDVLDTYVYRLGLNQLQYEVATAIGLFKSVISFFLITLSAYLAAKFANYRIF